MATAAIPSRSAPRRSKAASSRARRERGDVIVFKLPRDGKTDYIKRLIGLPGDRVQMKDGALWINGAPVTRERVDDYVMNGDFGRVLRVPQYRETLDNGVSYLTLDARRGGPADDTREFLVPDGHFFMMGDNRDNSQDSRVAGAVGFVPAENLVGRADFLFLSTESSAFKPWDWRLGRFFTGIE